MGRHAKPKLTDNTVLDVATMEDLLSFWREVMRGRTTTITDNGTLVDGTIPMELRLKASELLAKYTEKTAPRRPIVQDESNATATPEVIRLAKLIEQHDGLSDDEIEQAINLVNESTNG